MKRYLFFTLMVLAALGPLLLFGWFSGGLTPSVIAETRVLSPLEQSAQILAGLGIKPLYSLICLGLILFLVGQSARDIAALRWGLIAFLTGETFCAVNYFIFQHGSLLSEYLHSYGMALAFGLAAFAVFHGLDSRLLKINQADSHCAVGGVYPTGTMSTGFRQAQPTSSTYQLCGVCKRATPLECAARRSAQVIVAMTAVLAFIPLMAPLAPQAYAASLYGFPYSYTRFPFYEWYENRALPLMALACFALACLPLLRKDGLPIPPWSKAFFCAGLGALGFSFFRLTLASIFRENLVWFEFWEETTELMFILGAGFFLWQFKHILEKTAPVKWLLEELR
jgi:hypothetical protein